MSTKAKTIASLGIIGIFAFCLLFFHKEQKTAKPIVTVELQGQMGNQFFQMATAYAYAKDNNCELIIPKKYFRKSLFGIKQNCKKIFFRFNYQRLTSQIPKTYYQPGPYNYQPIPFTGSVKLQGFFESEKYFAHRKTEIQQLFAPSQSLLNKIYRRYGQYLSHPKCIGVHIRTYYKDYLGSKEDFFNYYPAPDMEYIKKAMNQFDDDSLFLVCSDHIPWCKKALANSKKNIIFIEGRKRYEDFYLLTRCKHNIITNSTFSWWIAYLNPNPDKKIIVRTPWFTDPSKKDFDIVPEEWTCIHRPIAAPIPDFSTE